MRRSVWQAVHGTREEEAEDRMRLRLARGEQEKPTEERGGSGCPEKEQGRTQWRDGCVTTPEFTLHTSPGLRRKWDCACLRDNCAVPIYSQSQHGLAGA